MFVWNQFAQQILDKLFDKIKTENKVSIPFLIISWPSHIGKTTLAMQHIKDLLGDFLLQDFLHIKDFSENLWKQHSLRIERKSWEVSDTLQKEYNYTDIWTREINERLAQSSLSGRKVVLIENIDRMTISAANALLKTCEEPLEGRLIIATTSSINSLLDTIVSRAFLIRMQTVWLKDIQKLANDIFTENTKKNPDQIWSFVNMSMWRPWILYNLADEKKQEYYQNFFEQIDSLNKTSSLSDKFILLKNIHKNYDINLFLNYIVWSMNWIWEEINICQRMLSANVNKESILLKIAQILSEQN